MNELRDVVNEHYLPRRRPDFGRAELRNWDRVGSDLTVSVGVVGIALAAMIEVEKSCSDRG